MLTQPTKYGPYLLLERVSLGGMAEVFKAIEFGVDGFERLVAVKRILPHVAEDEEFITMFKDEARIAVQLQHGNIAQIYSLGHEADSFYIALEYVAGQDLRTVFERCRKQGSTIPVPHCCFIMTRVCEGLDYAHNKKSAQGEPLNIIHRDVSPPNVLVSYEGAVKLCDFGVAKAAGRVSQTQAGILKGKFGYMSPEQVKGQDLDRRSDVFAAGVCLWELLTGRRLFHGDTDFSTLEKVRAGDVPIPRTINSDIPEALEEIIMDALAVDPDQRIPTASKLQERLQAFLYEKYRMFSRKQLADWMRIHYASEIEAEKSRERERREEVERFKKTMSAGSAPKRRPTGLGPPVSPGLPPPPLPQPPVTSSNPTPRDGLPALADDGQGTGNRRAPPKPRGRAKTLLTSALAHEDSVDQGGSAAIDREEVLGAAAGRRPASQRSAQMSGLGTLEWDDEELETRLFEDEEDLSDLASSASSLGRKQRSRDPLEALGGGLDPAARRSAGDRAGSDAMPLGKGPSSRPASRFRMPSGLHAAPESKPSSFDDAAEVPLGAPARSAAQRSGAFLGASSKFGKGPYSNSVSNDFQFSEPAKNYRWLWGVMIGAAVVMVAVMLYTLGFGGSEPEVPVANAEGSTPAVQGGVNGAQAGQTPGQDPGKTLAGAVQFSLSPASARVSINGVEHCCGPTLTASNLGAGTHQLVIDGGPDYLPYGEALDIEAGKTLSRNIKLNARKVQLQIRAEPSRAVVSLLQGEASKRIGRGEVDYTLNRDEGESYKIRVTARGYEAKEVLVPLSPEKQQQLSISLVSSSSKHSSRVSKSSASKSSASKGSKAGAKAGGAKSGAGDAAKSSMLKIGGKLGLPPATVFINGRRVGKTPLNLAVVPGVHHVEWRWDNGDKKSSRVSVVKDETKTVRGAP